MVYHAQMVAGLCLQNRTQLVDIRSGSIANYNCNIIDSELAELEGSNEESGGGFEI
jgi:hypothetical protein